MDRMNIKPDLSFRFSPNEISEYYGEARVAFANGDFMTSVQLCKTSDQLKACSLILSGLTLRGIDLLSDIKTLTSDSVLCLAYAYWVEGYNSRAVNLCSQNIKNDFFSKEELKRIRMLRELIERDEINIVITGAIVPVHRGHDDEHLFCSKYRYGQFALPMSTQICHESKDLTAVEGQSSKNKSLSAYNA